MNWYEISAVSAAGAFVVLVFYMIWTLQRVKALLRVLDTSLKQITHTLDETARLSRQLMRAMRSMLDDLHMKSRQMQGVYDTIIDLGKTLKTITSVLKRSSEFLVKFAGDKKSSHSSKQKRSPCEGTQSDSSCSESSLAMEWMQAGLDCFKRVQDLHRNQKRKSESAE